MRVHTTVPDSLAPLAGVVGSVGRFWSARSSRVQIALVLLFLFAKNGFDIELRNIQEGYLPTALQFPSPSGYWSASFGQPGVAHLLGLSTTVEWVAFHGLATIVTIVIACVLAARCGQVERSLALLIVAAATASSTLLIGIGKYDVFTVLGAFVLVLARHPLWSFAGALIMTSGNPEQAIVAAIALLAVSFAPPPPCDPSGHGHWSRSSCRSPDGSQCRPGSLRTTRTRGDCDSSAPTSASLLVGSRDLQS